MESRADALVEPNLDGAAALSSAGVKSSWLELSAKRVLALTFVGQLALLGLMLLATLFVSQRLTALESALHTDHREVEATRHQVEALVAQSQALKTEVTNLRMTMASLTEEDDIGTNIRYGLQVLGVYQEMHQDLETALTAYNRGPGPVDNAMVKGKDYRNGYAAKVLGVYERLKQLNVRTATL